MVKKPLSRLPEQARAADPNNSVWVSANAGSGKTFVLADRVVRLLLEGTMPGRILCLTFTKAAAAEMENRVFAQLAGWATADDETLQAELHAIGYPGADATRLAFARTLFARALETPGGLKILTIHAFCERLLHQFPFEANVPAHFEVIDDGEKAEMLKDAQYEVIRNTIADPDSRVARALSDLTGELADSSFDDILKQLTGVGDQLEDWIAAAGGLDQALHILRSHFEVGGEQSSESLRAEIMDSPILPRSEWPEIIPILDQGNDTSKKIAGALSGAAEATVPEDALVVYKQGFLTGTDAPKKRWPTKAISDHYPELAEKLLNEQSRVHELVWKIAALEFFRSNEALFTFGANMLERYRVRKIASGKLEFSDLIERSVNLLKRSGAASWVLYKLDGGIDHILVDEAQDTSPQQWEIVQLLAQEALAGEGVQGRQRTIFAVGDEKQSIFSFQGAEPDRFEDMRRYFERKVAAIERSFDTVPLNLSFRSVPAILEAVDKVFENPAAAKGLTSKDEPITHLSHRKNKPGLVELWDPVHAETKDAETAWRAPLDAVDAGSAPVQLATKIAETIAHWLQSGEKIAATGRAITAGDILVLVRRRTHIVTPLIKALREREIAVAGADRLTLQDHLAVKDLLVAADFVLLPDDDLALATLLRSPLIGLNEDDLFDLAYQRNGSLWRALRDNEARHPEPVHLLQDWLAKADFVTPYAFFAEILGAGGGREKLVRRLGPEAEDSLNEFLNLAIEFESRNTPSLQGFVHWMRAQSRDIKREMEEGNDEVRIMTVHGAKGLEAPIVFLPDTCAIPEKNKVAPILPLQTDTGGNTPNGLIWVKGGADALPEQARVIKDAAYEKLMEEHNRLLYVAMTRASDRLYVCGHRGKNNIPDDCWYRLIEMGLQDATIEVTNEEGETVRRFTGTVPYRILDPESAPTATAATPPMANIPDLTVPPPPAQAPIPNIAPSRLDDEIASPGIPRNAADPGSGGLDTIDPRVRGNIIHKLIEGLAQREPEDRQTHARLILEIMSPDLDEETAALLADEALSVLEASDLSFLFTEDSRAEVPVAGEISDPAGSGKTVHASGVIDRLVVEDKRIVIADFKSNRIVPEDTSQVPPAYHAQMASYRSLVGAMFPGKEVAACLVWTANSSVTWIGNTGA